MRYVIVGNGVAGTTAALHIRRLDPEGEIRIVTNETLPFYSRIRLIDYLAGTATEQDLVIFKGSWYADSRVALLMRRTVTSVLAADGSITLDDGTMMRYDRLLLATGSNPAMPPVEGRGKQGVFTLRTIDDARAILEYVANAQSVILLGGGVLGIEIANALRTRGKKISVIELFSRLLPRQTDPEGSHVLQGMLESRGLVFHLGVRVSGILGASRAEGILLEDGTVIQGDAVIVAAGVRPATDLASRMGLSCPAGIPVNDRMETELAGIYAAGDAANHRGTCYGIWATAEKQGEIAGINMAGGEAFYTAAPPSHILKVAGIQLLSAGEIDADGRLSNKVIKDPQRGVYRKFVTRDGILVGCILIGDLTGRKEILAALAHHRALDTLEDSLIN